MFSKWFRTARKHGARSLWLGLLALVCCIAIGALVKFNQGQIPVVKGESLALWFEDPDVASLVLHGGTPGGARNGPPSEAVMAFLEADGDALPFLAKIARRRPSKASALYYKLYAGLGPLQSVLPKPTSAEEYRRRQARALSVIGMIGYWQRQEHGRPSRNRSFDNRLLNGTLAYCMSDPDSWVRQTAMQAAGCAWNQTMALLPEITQMLDSSPIGSPAIQVVGCYREHASNAVPKLVSLLARETHAEDQLLLRTIGDIGAPAEPALGRLVQLLGSTTNQWIQRAAAQAIYQIQKTPEAALPVLRDLTNNGHLVHTRQCAALALWNINRSDPALVAGVSNAISDSPLLGTYHLRSAKLDSSARILIPVLTSLTNKPEGRVVQSALEWVQSK